MGNQSIAAAKRKLEAEMQTLNADLDEMTAEAKLCEDKAAKSMVDAARLAEELRGEQDVAQQVEKARKILEAQSKDLQQRLDEAETNALKGGKKAMNKMETRIRELESEMDAENRRQADTLKNLLLLTSPNSARLLLRLILQPEEPMLLNKHLPKAVPVDVAALLDPNKRSIRHRITPILAVL